MAILGSAIYKLIADATSLNKGLRDAERNTKTAADKGERQTGRMRAAFGKVGTSVKNAAGQIPFLGGALTQLATPVGAITLAVGGLAAVLGGSVKKIIDVERNLRPMIERSRIGAEALQVLAEAAERAGSEDGLEGVVDTSQELQLQLGELALTGAARAEEALEALGLQAERLAAMKPEEAWRRVVEEIQKIPNVADRATAAEEIFGGTSEKLAGIINMTNREFEDLIRSVEETADVLSEDALRSAQEFDREWRKITGTFGQVRTAIGTVLLPHITQFIDKINRMVQDIRTAREQIATGWDVIKQKTVDALNAIIQGYNRTIGKLPGVAKLDMIEIKESVEGTTDAFDDMGDTTEVVAERTGVSFRKMAEDAKAGATEMVEAVEEGQERILTSEEQFGKALARLQWDRRKERVQAERDAAAEIASIREDLNRQELADLTRHTQRKIDQETAAAQQLLGIVARNEARRLETIRAAQEAEMAARVDFATRLAEFMDGPRSMTAIAAGGVASSHNPEGFATGGSGVGGGGGGGGVGMASRIGAAGAAVVAAYEGRISALIQRIMANNERMSGLPFSQQLPIRQENERIQAEIDALKAQRDAERRAAERRAGRGAGPSSATLMDRGGIVTGPTLAALAMNGRPEAVIPLDRAGGGIGGPQIVFQGDVYGFDQFDDRIRDAIDVFTRRGGTFN